MIIEFDKYLVDDNSTLALNKAVDAASEGDTILFGKDKIYHFYKDFSEVRNYHFTNTDSFKNPNKHFAMLIENKNNLTLDGNGSTFVIHGDITSLALVKCKGITLKNFRITYNSPTNFEMKVVEKKSNKIIYQVPADTSFYLYKHSVYFVEESILNDEVYYSYKNNKNCYCNVLHRDNEVFRTQKSPIKTALSFKKLDGNKIEASYLIKPRLDIGDTIAMSRNWNRDGCGLFFWECSDIVSKNIIVNYMHGFGWLSQMCENLTFKHIDFTPDRDRGYTVSSFADCIHVCGCKGFVDIEHCLFEHPHDDGINIHGAFLRLKKVIDKNTAVFEFVHKQQGGYSNFFAGDRVKLYSRRNLSEIGDTLTVKSYIDDIDNKCVTLEFNEPLPQIKNKMVVAENISYNPKVKIKNCLFKNIPTRGILCTTSEESEISFNTFDSLKMPDIYISCDCKDWYESGPCKNMKIHHNNFSQENPVKLEPLCLGKPIANVHENIEIYDND